MKTRILFAVMALLLNIGCDSQSKWVEQQVRYVSSSISVWRTSYSRYKKAEKCYFQDENFLLDDLLLWTSNTINTAINYELFMAPSRFPVSAKFSKVGMRKGLRKQVLNGPLHDRLARFSDTAYEMQFLMFGSRNAWEYDRIYFVELFREEVNVIVVDVSKLNERWCSGGCSMAPGKDGMVRNEVGEDVRVFKATIRNIVDDVFRGFNAPSFEQFLKNASEGKSAIIWDCGGCPLVCGRHIYDRKEFYEWISNRRYTYPLRLIRATESEWIFVVDNARL